MSRIKQLLGNRIKSLRNKKGITQEFFAEQIGISTRSVSFIETGKNYPSPETLEIICSVLGIEPYELFLFSKEYDVVEIKKILIDKINSDDDFAFVLYDYSKQFI